MSQEERDYLEWLKRAKDGSISQRAAAERMGVSSRWVRELLTRMDQHGDAVVVHGLRGRPSNRKLSAQTQRQALAILKQPDWHDFGPTFATEQLGQRHQIRVGKETLRKWMMEERVIGNDYTFSFAGRRYQIQRAEVQAGMRRQRLRVELRLDGELKARYQGRYVEIGECGVRPITAKPKPNQSVRKDHNAGGKSHWMDGFFNRPSPPLWKCFRN
jgi:transposase